MRLTLSRPTRWTAAALATVLVAAGVGYGVRLTGASSPTPNPVVTTITPCRLLDTRPGSDNVGPRSTPLGPNETYTTPVRGTNGNCTIPGSALGVVMNVTVVGGTRDSFLTVWPAGATRPLASNLNWVAGQPPTPNQVTTALGPDGRISFYNLAGTVHVVGDITGYLADHAHDDRYFTKEQVDNRPQTMTFPAQALNLDPGSPYVALHGAGLQWQNDTRGYAMLSVHRPGGWNGDYPALRIAFVRTSDAAGSVRFSVEPQSVDPGGVLVDPPSYLTTASSTTGTGKLQEVYVLLPYAEMQRAWWIVKISRDVTAGYAAAVWVTSVAITYLGS
jgi:hypothetical protein